MSSEPTLGDLGVQQSVRHLHVHFHEWGWSSRAAAGGGYGPASCPAAMRGWRAGDGFWCRARTRCCWWCRCWRSCKRPTRSAAANSSVPLAPLWADLPDTAAGQAGATTAAAGGARRDPSWSLAEATMPTSIRATAVYLLLDPGRQLPVPAAPAAAARPGARGEGVRRAGLLPGAGAVPDPAADRTTATISPPRGWCSLGLDDPAVVARVFSATMAAKLTLTLAAALLMAGIARAGVPSLREHWTILAAAPSSAWWPYQRLRRRSGLYQGLERMKVLVVPNCTAKAGRPWGACWRGCARRWGRAALAALGISVGTVPLALAALWGIHHRQRLASLVAVSVRERCATSFRDGFSVFLSLVLVSFYVILSTPSCSTTSTAPWRWGSSRWRPRSAWRP